MPKTSAGILLYRKRKGTLEVLLIHPGGPYFKNRDEGAWSIPKGEIDEGEEPLAAAKREFQEEIGCRVNGRFLPLTAIQQKSGKMVISWAVEGDCEAESISSNSFTLEWPPKSGRMRQFPEADRAAWFTLEEAKRKIIAAQSVLLDELLTRYPALSS